MTDIIVTGLGDIFIKLTDVSQERVEGKRIDRRHREPDTYRAVTEEFRLNVADIFAIGDYARNDYEGLAVKPAARVNTIKNGVHYNVKETPEQIEQKINDAKVAAAKLIADALRPIPPYPVKTPIRPL